MEQRNRKINRPAAHLLLFWFVLPAITAVQAQDPVRSGAYNWKDLNVEKEKTRERRQVLDGTTTDLVQLEIHTSTLQPGMAPHPPHTHTDQEELLIVKEGNLEVTIKRRSATLGPGGVAYVLPGDEHGFENGGTTPVTYYVLKFKSRRPFDPEVGSGPGGSFMIDWNDLTVSKTGKGERRNVVDRATGLFDRFEMHVTTLNEGLKSHDPHKHRAEEILLIIKGNAEIQVGEAHEKAEPGAVVFLGSQVLHNLSNIGKGPCQYFAFQWQVDK